MVPAIVNPMQAALTPSTISSSFLFPTNHLPLPGPPGANATRTLLLVGKAIQTLSNKAVFEKEEYMAAAVGEYTTGHRDEVDVLYAKLLEEPQPLKGPPAEPRYRRDLAGLAMILQPRREELVEKNPESQELVGTMIEYLDRLEAAKLSSFASSPTAPVPP